jgi:PBP1b-binding outer membrane lipoprotein LpoB
MTALAAMRSVACNRLYAILMACTTVLLVAPVRAEIYTCKDATGRVITSDRPMIECANSAIRVLRPDGATKRLIPAPLNEEQKLQKEIADAKAREETARLRDQKQRDGALTAAFPTMKALEDSRKRQIAEINAEIDTSKKRIESKYPDLKKATAEMEFYRKQAAPYDVKSRIQLAANAILVEDQLIQAKRGEIQALNEKYDSDAKRLRELIDPSTGKLAQAAKH